MDAASKQTVDTRDALPELPGYRVERRIGRGSTGVVYLAEDEQLHRKVALKVVESALAEDDLFRRRFERESRSAANLDHPNVVPVFATGEAAGQLYIAMRYVAGGDLRALLETKGPLSLECTASIISSIGNALDAAHDDGMIHRDVKPANILIDDRSGKQHYYLSDFGIAKAVASGTSLTTNGQIVGTIDYIAPEQIQGKPVDGRADLYALGCVLYQCLTDQVPFPRDDVAALMWAHVHDEPPPVTGVRPDLPAAIDAVLAKALAKLPEGRFATGHELADVLRELAENPDAVPAALSAASPEAVSSAPVGAEVPAVSLADAGDGDPATLEDAGLPSSSLAAGMTSTYTPPAPPKALETPVAAPAKQRRRLWWATGGVAVLAVTAGLTMVGVNYANSRFPNQTEQALIDLVPLALQKSCVRNDQMEQDTANVRASVSCSPPGGDVNSYELTKFTSPEALQQHYQAAASTVSSSGAPVTRGDCGKADRADGAYASDSGQSSGRVLCYQQRGSSFMTWTDNGSQTMGSAARYDPDQEKLRSWWAGVQGVKLPDKAAAPPPAPPAVAAVGPSAPAETPDLARFGRGTPSAPAESASGSGSVAGGDQASAPEKKGKPKGSGKQKDDATEPDQSSASTAGGEDASPPAKQSAPQQAPEADKPKKSAPDADQQEAAKKCDEYNIPDDMCGAKVNN